MMSNVQTPKTKADISNLKRLNKLRRFRKEQESFHESKWKGLQRSPKSPSRKVQITNNALAKPKTDTTADQTQSKISQHINAYLIDSRKSLERQQSMMHDANFHKETLTHDGSCGAYALSVGFCINILEGRYYGNATSSQKLLISWNTTYPKRECSSIEALQDYLKDYLATGNTEDMESLIGPVIRVYIGLALSQSSQTGDINDRFQHVLSDDFSRTWGEDVLNNRQKADVRNAVAHAARTHADLFFGESNDKLSYGYYLDDQDLAVVSQELLGLDIKKVIEVNDRPQPIRNVSRIIKKNNTFLEEYASKQNITIEPCSVNSADPSRVVKGFNNEEGHFESIRIESEEYVNWQLMKGKIADIMGHHNPSNAAKYIEQQLTQGNLSVPSNLHDRCEEEIYAANETTVLSQLEKGIKRFWVDKVDNLETQQVHILHSNSVYWDVLLTESQYRKYSRNTVARKHSINHTDAYVQIGESKSQLLNQNIYPYISTCVECINEMLRECQASCIKHVDKAIDLVQEFSKSRLNLTILLLAIVLFCTVGTLAASMITVGILFIKHTLQAPTRPEKANLSSMNKLSVRSTELYHTKSPKAQAYHANPTTYKHQAKAIIDPSFGEASDGFTIGI
jgi:hypothetical protein